MATTIGNWDKYVDALDVAMATGKYGSRAAAGVAVQAAHPEYRNVTPGGTGTSAGASRPSGGSSESAMDAMAKEIRRGNPALTKEQAYAQALRENPEVYEQYLTEHPAQRLHAHS